MNAATQVVVEQLRAHADPSRLPGMARVGIRTDRAIGVSIPDLRAIARRHRGDHRLALELWRTKIHEARILASMVDDPLSVTDDQLERWVIDLDSWDVCDQVCGNLFRATPAAVAKAKAWSGRSEEFVKRAGFALIAELAVHDRTSPDRAFTAWFPAIRRGAADDRNYVKKAVSWALRSIGKRNLSLNAAAIAEAQRLTEAASPSARWIGRDALRELRFDDHQQRLRGQR